MGKTISFTAFLVNESRNRLREISGDIYAHLWVNEDVIKSWDEFAEKVTPYDDIVISVRHSFFLERIKKFLDLYSDGTIINFGSGFTSYPFLIDGPVKFIEIDRSEVIDYKKDKISAWVKNKNLPERNIQFLSADLKNENERQIIFNKISSFVADKPSFILMEGLTYFLNEESFNHILDQSRSLQVKGSQLAFDYWRPEFYKSTLFRRLEDFVEREWGFAKSEYFFLTESTVKNTQGYNLINSSNGFLQEKLKIGSQNLKDPDNTMVENYAVLQRQ